MLQPGYIYTNSTDIERESGGTLIVAVYPPKTRVDLPHFTNSRGNVVVSFVVENLRDKK